MRQYLKTDRGKEVVYNNVLKYWAKNKEKLSAWQKVSYALKTGRLFKPKNCEQCLEIKPLDGHHADYDKPLRVNWLCRACHYQQRVTLSQ